MKSCTTLAVLATLLVAHALPAAEMPRLERQGSATQLIVDGAPFLIRGGELGNKVRLYRYR